MERLFLNDPQSEQGSVCPRNFLGLKDHRVLARIEDVFGKRRILELHDQGVTGTLGLEHFKAIHRYLFQDVLPWAGLFRVVDISKGITNFGPAVYIESALAELLERLSREGLLKGLTAEAFVPRAAFYLGEINAIHPFREGNGRVQREFIRQLALHAGHPLSWAGFTQQEMVDASILSNIRGDNSGLARILERAREAAR